MDRLLKKRFREYYADKHRLDPGISFEESFPRSGRRSLAHTGHVAFFGLAASVLLVIGALLFYRGSLDGRPAASPGFSDGMLLTGLEQGLLRSAVLGLSRAQASSLNEELERYFWTAAVEGLADVDATRQALLQTLLESPALALNDEQAMAMTGLLSSWKPGLADKSSPGKTWLDDNSLAHYVADCSSYCHQPGDAAVYSNTALRSYLLACVDTRKTAACAAGQMPGGARENGLF